MSNVRSIRKVYSAPEQLYILKYVKSNGYKLPHNVSSDKEQNVSISLSSEINSLVSSYNKA